MKEEPKLVINPFGEIERSNIDPNELANYGKNPSQKAMPSLDMPIFEPPKQENPSVMDNQTKKISEKKGKIFTIMDAKKAVSSAYTAKTNSAVMAGLCIIGAIGAAYFHNQEVNQVVNTELKMFWSMETIAQYVENIGGATTFLSTCALGFIGKYLADSQKMKKSQQELEKLFSYVGLRVGGNERNDQTR